MSNKYYQLSCASDSKISAKIVTEKIPIIEEIINADGTKSQKETHKTVRYGLISGIASASSYNKSHKLIVDELAFAKSINLKGFKGANAIRLKYEHNPQTNIGFIRNLSYDEHDKATLNIQAAIYLDNPEGDKLYNSILKAGCGFSVGFVPKQTTIKNKIQHILEGDLLEISLTDFPSNTDCGVLKCLSSNKTDEVKDMETEEKIAQLAEEQKAIINTNTEILKILSNIQEFITSSTVTEQEPAVAKVSATSIADESIEKLSTAIAEKINTKIPTEIKTEQNSSELEKVMQRLESIQMNKKGDE